MTLSLLPNGRQQFLDLNAVPLVGGTVEHYLPGTLTLADTWQDQAGTIVNPHPITLDSIGSAEIWGTGSYRQIVSDALGNLIWDVVTTAPASGVGALLAANNLSDVASAATSRTNLGLGTAALATVGTSGATVPLLSTANTWTLAQTFSATAVASAGVRLTQAATPTTDAAGYLVIPQNAQTVDYTLAMTDIGGEIFLGATKNINIPTAATVAFPRGTTIKLSVDQTFVGTVIPAGGVTLRWLIGNATGNRTLTGPASATISLEKANEWWIAGVNIS
jgi:hypothetical protein